MNVHDYLVLSLILYSVPYWFVIYKYMSQPPVYDRSGDRVNYTLTGWMTGLYAILVFISVIALVNVH